VIAIAVSDLNSTAAARALSQMVILGPAATCGPRQCPDGWLCRA
jgi:hypothetical protein